MTKIYHNPRCSKSRQALALLEAKGEEIEIIKYLDETFTPAELQSVIDLLGICAFDLVRKGETIYKEEYKDKEMTDEEWVLAMVENPKLIERPIVIKDNQAVIGRPPENVLEIL
ncbi:arsenate reductase (glutaredoxin) [Reichenbachiella versicolor]|uniref:arsenate reductase (glutaredoxin) n=1 Tax=Reichenbachiella versicolor TaxID=1821036 RepID=UPI000D6E633D|nr:arsenate reductase (glutaredoxin) [Reichenbachiella versicolor]